MQHGALRITLNYIHPPSAKESNFVFNRPSHGRSQRRKRRREVIDIGEPPALCSSPRLQAMAPCLTEAACRPLRLG